MGIPVTGGDPVAEIMRLAKRLAGIDLSAGRRSLVESRLGRRLRLLSCDMAGYLGRLREDRCELAVCLDLLTANHTFWLREADHFADFERRLLPALAGGGQRRARVWCASATTGEEPYSIALCLLRSRPAPPWDASVFATDLSTRALACASDGIYTEDRVAQLNAADRQLALELAHKGPPRVWRVKPELKRLVNLARLNLLDDDWPMHGPFEAIFCRNVMSYFDCPAQERLVGRFADLLASGGTLYVGQGENERMARLGHPLKALAAGIYLKA